MLDWVNVVYVVYNRETSNTEARLAQSEEHETVNLRVVGSSPTLGDRIIFFFNRSFSLVQWVNVVYVVYNRETSITEARLAQVGRA
ncbi:hypothetical protein C0J52_11478 [Blattella germanica]|nr:hypothetical protein C0J52_11478 [Blattella germanica]